MGPGTFDTFLCESRYRSRSSISWHFHNFSHDLKPLNEKKIWNLYLMCLSICALCVISCRLGSQWSLKMSKNGMSSWPRGFKTLTMLSNIESGWGLLLHFFYMYSIITKINWKDSAVPGRDICSLTAFWFSIFTLTACQTYWQVSGLRTPSAPPSSLRWGSASAPPHDRWWGWCWNKQMSELNVQLQTDSYIISAYTLINKLTSGCQCSSLSPVQSTHKGFADLYSSVSESSSSEYWVSPLPPARSPRATRSPAAFPYPVYFNRLSTTRRHHRYTRLWSYL